MVNSVFTAYCEPGNINPGDQVAFEWFLDNIPIAGQNQSQVQLNAPGIQSQPVLKCRISFNGVTAEDTLHLRIVERIPIPPIVNGIESGSKYTVKGETNTFTALSEPAPGEILEYTWSASTGILNQTMSSSVTWQAPETPGIATITVHVTNQDMLSTTVSTSGTGKRYKPCYSDTTDMVSL